MAVLAVNRYKELGPYGVEHGAELIAPTMAGNVHRARPVVADIGPHAVHLVDQPVDGARIAGMTREDMITVSPSMMES